MAKLDKSQGFTFVFSDLHEIYQKAKNQNLGEAFALDRGQQSAFLQPMSVKEAEDKAMKKLLVSRSVDSIASLRENLNNLNKAHAKLRFLLQELETITKRSK